MTSGCTCGVLREILRPIALDVWANMMKAGYVLNHRCTYARDFLHTTKVTSTRSIVYAKCDKETGKDEKTGFTRNLENRDIKYLKECNDGGNACDDSGDRGNDNSDDNHKDYELIPLVELHRLCAEMDGVIQQDGYR